MEATLRVIGGLLLEDIEAHSSPPLTPAPMLCNGDADLMRLLSACFITLVAVVVSVVLELERIPSFAFLQRLLLPPPLLPPPDPRPMPWRFCGSVLRS